MEGPAGRRLTRRRALIGAGVVAGGVALSAQVAATVSYNALLLELGQKLDRLRRRGARLHRRVRHLAARAEQLLYTGIEGGYLTWMAESGPIPSASRWGTIRLGRPGPRQSIFRWPWPLASVESLPPTLPGSP